VPAVRSISSGNGRGRVRREGELWGTWKCVVRRVLCDYESIKRQRANAAVNSRNSISRSWVSRIRAEPPHTYTARPTCCLNDVRSTRPPQARREQSCLHTPNDNGARLASAQLRAPPLQSCNCNHYLPNNIFPGTFETQTTLSQRQQVALQARGRCRRASGFGFCKSCELEVPTMTTTAAAATAAAAAAATWSSITN
jgi:hypothetical protein